MSFNAIAFCQDYNIEYVLEGKNVSQGWVGINDPFSIKGDTSHHGGINPDGAYYYSWRSGWHPLEELIIELLGVTYLDAKMIIKQYSYESFAAEVIKVKERFTISDYPTTRAMRDFLRFRKFNAKYIIEKYDVRGSADGKKLVIPVYYNGEIVSYQERNIDYKFYKACSKEKAILNYKDILYNLDNCVIDTVVVVEGVTDVWRMGDNCACTFGKSVTKRQLILLGERFKKIIFMFDPEYEAQKDAKKIGVELAMMGAEIILEKDYCELFDKKDPGELTNKQAKQIMNKLLN